MLSSQNQLGPRSGGALPARSSGLFPTATSIPTLKYPKAAGRSTEEISASSMGSLGRIQTTKPAAFGSRHSSGRNLRHKQQGSTSLHNSEDSRLHIGRNNSGSGYDIGDDGGVSADDGGNGNGNGNGNDNHNDSGNRVARGSNWNIILNGSVDLDDDSSEGSVFSIENQDGDGEIDSDADARDGPDEDRKKKRPRKKSKRKRRKASQSNLLHGVPHHQSHMLTPSSHQRTPLAGNHHRSQVSLGSKSKSAHIEIDNNDPTRPWSSYSSAHISKGHSASPKRSSGSIGSTASGSTTLSKGTALAAKAVKRGNAPYDSKVHPGRHLAPQLDIPSPGAAAALVLPTMKKSRSTLGSSLLVSKRGLPHSAISGHEPPPPPPPLSHKPSLRSARSLSTMAADHLAQEQLTETAGSDIRRTLSVSFHTSLTKSSVSSLQRESSGAIYKSDTDARESASTFLPRVSNPASESDLLAPAQRPRDLSSAASSAHLPVPTTKDIVTVTFADPASPPRSPSPAPLKTGGNHFSIKPSVSKSQTGASGDRVTLPQLQANGHSHVDESHSDRIDKQTLERILSAHQGDAAAKSTSSAKQRLNSSRKHDPDVSILDMNISTPLAAPTIPQAPAAASGSGAAMHGSQISAHSRGVTSGSSRQNQMVWPRTFVHPSHSEIHADTDATIHFPTLDAPEQCFNSGQRPGHSDGSPTASRTHSGLRSVNFTGGGDEPPEEHPHGDKLDPQLETTDEDAASRKLQRLMSHRPPSARVPRSTPWPKPPRTPEPEPSNRFGVDLELTASARDIVTIRKPIFKPNASHRRSTAKSSAANQKRNMSALKVRVSSAFHRIPPAPPPSRPRTMSRGSALAFGLAEGTKSYSGLDDSSSPSRAKTAPEGIQRQQKVSIIKIDGGIQMNNLTFMTLSGGSSRTALESAGGMNTATGLYPGTKSSDLAHRLHRETDIGTLSRWEDDPDAKVITLDLNAMATPKSHDVVAATDTKGGLPVEKHADSKVGETASGDTVLRPKTVEVRRSSRSVSFTSITPKWIEISGAVVAQSRGWYDCPDGTRIEGITRGSSMVSNLGLPIADSTEPSVEGRKIGLATHSLNDDLKGFESKINEALDQRHNSIPNIRRERPAARLSSIRKVQSNPVISSDGDKPPIVRIQTLELPTKGVLRISPIKFDLHGFYMDPSTLLGEHQAFRKSIPSTKPSLPTPPRKVGIVQPQVCPGNWMVVKPVVESTRPPPKLLSLEPPPPPPATPANLGYDWYYTDGDSALAMHPGVETPAPSVSSLQGTVAGTTAAPQASSEPPETMDVVQGLILNDRRRSMMGIRPITPHQYMSDLPAPTIPLHGPVDVAVLQESEKETIARRMSLIAEKRPPTAQRHQTMQARPCSGVQRERQRSIVKPHDPRPIIPEVPAEDERASSVLPSALAIVRRQLYLIGYAIVAIQRAWRHFATVRKRMFYHDAATFIQRHYRYWKLARYYREMMKSMTGDASFDFDHSLSTWSQLNHTVRERETDSLTNIKFRRFRVYIRTRKEASKPVIHHIDGRAADVGVAGDVDGGTEGLTNAAALQDTQHMDSSDNSGAIPSQLEHTVQDAGEIELVWGLVGLWSTAFDCGSLPKEDRLLLGMASDTRHDHDHVRFHDDFHAPGQRSVHTTDSKTGDIITADSRRPSKVAMERRRSSVSSRRSNQTHSEDTDLEPTTHSPMGSTHKMVSRNESNSVPGKSSRRASVVKPGYKRQRSFSVGSDPRKGDTEPSSEAAADIARERFKRSRQPSKESDNSSQLTDATAEARNSAVERRHQRSHSMVEYSPSYSKFTAAHGLSGIQDIGDDAESDSLNGTIISENSSEYQWNSWYGHSKSVAPPAPPKRSVLHHPFHHGLMHLVPAQAVVEVLRGLVQIAGADVRLNLGGDPLDGSFEKSLRDLGWESRQERSRSSSARQGCRSGRASIAKPG